MPDFPQGPWFSGQPLSYPVPTPLRYAIDARRKGNVMPYYRCAYPLMRMDLLDAVRDAGVDNLELFDAIVDDPQRTTTHTDFKAVNVLGVAALADLSKTTRHGTRPEALISADIASLTIDEARAADLLMVRLAESVSAVVVDERVKRVVEARGIPGMTFYDPGEWGTL
ncbi:MAG: hypothetical protein MUE41_06610 [Gemmatimonadaceae bacterium]|nr:hypothetical protein [Gemmatimonadaceae bacterium]